MALPCYTAERREEVARMVLERCHAGMSQGQACAAVERETGVKAATALAWYGALIPKDERPRQKPGGRGTRPYGIGDDEAARRDEEVTTTRCARCPFTFDGPLKDGRAAFATHTCTAAA